MAKAKSKTKPVKKPQAAKTSAKKPAPKAAAQPAEKVLPAAKAAGNAGASPAAKAGSGDAKAKSLLKQVDVVLPKDQVKPVVAALQAAGLANSGALSPDVALDVWRMSATQFCHATSEKARKAQNKELAARGFASKDAFIVDCCRRWLAAKSEKTEDTFFISWALIQALIDSGSYDDAIAEFKKWTPTALELGRGNKLEYVFDYAEHWFGSYVWKLTDRNPDESARAKKMFESEKARAS